MNDQLTEITATSAQEKKEEYVPPPPKRKRKKKQRLPPVGVAGLLDYARIKFGDGSAEYDVEEDENGQYKIGNEELSFESWGQMIKTKEDGVFVANIALPKQKIRRPRLIYDVETPLTTSNGRNAKKGKATKAKPTKVDKDEGEISDSEESDVSTSSSDSDSAHAYRKHNKRQRTSAANMDAKEIFTKGYQYRNLLVQSLNLQQKMAFFELLRGAFCGHCNWVAVIDENCLGLGNVVDERPGVVWGLKSGHLFRDEF